jgi:hypothetical protein
LAQVGQYQQAETVARAISSPDLQVRALADVAEALAKSGDIKSARRVVAAVCTVSVWVAAVRPVLTLEPSAFTLLLSRLNNE